MGPDHYLRVALEPRWASVLVTTNGEVERGLVRPLAQTGATTATHPHPSLEQSRPKMPHVSDTLAWVGRVLTCTQEASSPLEEALRTFPSQRDTPFGSPTTGILKTPFL